MLRELIQLFHPTPGPFAPFRAGARFAEGVEALAEQYQGTDPFPHIMLDGLFDAAYLRSVAADVPSPLARNDLFTKDEKHLQERKFAWRDVPRMGARSLAFIDALQSKPFLEFLTALTGIEGLLPDPYLWGAGYHQILSGGKLAIHADFNIHPQTKMYRRLNALVYLNENWDEAWGGQVELWDQEMKRCVQRIAPLMGRMVVFNTTETSFHGHPDPLLCPDDRVRRSLALYYYTWDYPQAEKHSTLWQKRPQDDEAVAHAAAEHRKVHG